MGHTRCMLDKQGYMHAGASTPPRARTPTCTHAHAHIDKYVMLIAFPRQQWFVNEPQCYVVRTLSVLFIITPTCFGYKLQLSSGSYKF
jgi:hypothetical protein